MGIALPTLLGLGSPVLLSDRYVNAFASYANGAVAQLVGIWFAINMAGLLQSAGVERAMGAPRHAAGRRQALAGLRALRPMLDIALQNDQRREKNTIKKNEPIAKQRDQEFENNNKEMKKK